MFFEEKRKKKKIQPNDDNITDRDVLELAYAYLNIFDIKECFTFLLSLQPKKAIFRTVQDLAKRLIDLGRIDELDELLHLSTREPYYVIAITSELFTIGRIPEAADINPCLDLLCSSKCRIENQNYSYNDRITPAIISFLEACVCRKLSSHNILRALRYYVPIRASRLVSDSHFSYDRDNYLKAMSIRMVLAETTDVDINQILPKEVMEKGKSHEQDDDIRKFKEVILGLIPWYLLRCNILYGSDININDAAKLASKASHQARNSRYVSNDALPYEVTEICVSILVLSSSQNHEGQVDFYHNFLHTTQAFRLHKKLELLRAVYRIPQLYDIGQELEPNCLEHIRSTSSESPDEIADHYITMARAVSIESVEDARVYFDEAVNIVSKFGDEIVQRWDAVVSLAEKASGEGEISHELAYRFIRCAELVGENVDREKYWDRSGALQACAKMSSGVAISAFSRWRDRHIGRFEYQLERLLIELVDSGRIVPSVGWSLTRFFSQHHLNDILSVCLERELSFRVRQSILDDAIYLQQIEGNSTVDYWEKLKEIASEYKLSSSQLDLIIDSFCKKESEPTKNREEYNLVASDSTNKDWDKLFNGISIATQDDFEELMQRFKILHDEEEFKWHVRDFHDEILKRLRKGPIGDFLEIVLLSVHINYYDALHIFSNLPCEWTRKVSFKKRWPAIVYRIGQRYANCLTTEYVFKSFTKELNLDHDLTEHLKSGILSGLENSSDITNAENFFSFAKLLSYSLDVNASIELTDYALSRFELHINDDFGDGVWNNWLEVSDDIYKNIAGFIWSALGSPRSAERWSAAHSIRKLVELNCTDVLDSLIEWLKHDKVDSFGCKQFPFYNFHAKQYLLIAFARASLDHPSRVRKYNELFSEYALSKPHILIQKYAAQIAINIQKEFPETYTEEIFAQLINVGKSALKVQEEKYEFTTNSYWHDKKEIDAHIDYNFAYDFDRYWYEPLSEVFGVPTKQIENLAANVIVHEWGIVNSGGYNKDPRVGLWNQSYSERETWHDHGSYPRTDNWDFYLSYHAMLVVAAKLIDKMPIIKTRGWYDDEWEEWLSRHILTPDNGKWLSDFRFPLPLKRPTWIIKEKKDNWRTDITEKDFIDCLKVIENKELWINVEGGWHEKDNERTETYSISSALVARETSDSLLRALQTCLDPYDYKLPYYKEDRMEIDNGIFVLKGWIDEHSNSLRLDEADPYTNDIAYPLYSIGDDIVKQFGLISINDGKQWINELNEILLTCETWSSYKRDKNEESDQSGIRLKATLSFLKSLCDTLDYDIILDVGINREVYYKYDRESRAYTRPQHKIFILSGNGRLKTTESDYQLG
jgi:aromatic ring-cleaving dioxygenase